MEEEDSEDLTVYSVDSGWTRDKPVDTD